MAKNRVVSTETGGSTVDSVIARLKAYQAMSEKERSEFIRKASRPPKKKLSESEWTMMMAADGYFQDENGDVP